MSLCKCGCGKKLPSGKQRMFINGHQNRGANHPLWNGGVIMSNGYRLIQKPEHPFRDKKGYVPEHRLVVEAVIGRELKRSEVVHHINGERSDNKNENLIVCDTKYHIEIHKRQKAYSLCGNAGWMLCKVCGEYDDPSNMTGGKQKYHMECNRMACRQYYIERKKKMVHQSETRSNQ